MFGLEKKTRALPEYDLEKDLKETPTKLKDLQKSVEEKIGEVKNALRHGAGSEDFDQLGILLNGYAALKKVLNRIANKK
jgi:hypothetical protein